MEPNNLNEWWDGQPDGLKQAFSLFPDPGGNRRAGGRRPVCKRKDSHPLPVDKGAAHVCLRVIQSIRDLGDIVCAASVSENIEIYLHILAVSLCHVSVYKFIGDDRHLMGQTVLYELSHLLHLSVCRFSCLSPPEPPARLQADGFGALIHWNHHNTGSVKRKHFHLSPEYHVDIVDNVDKFIFLLR